MFMRIVPTIHIPYISFVILKNLSGEKMSDNVKGD